MISAAVPDQLSDNLIGKILTAISFLTLIKKDKHPISRYIEIYFL